MQKTAFVQGCGTAFERFAYMYTTQSSARIFIRSFLLMAAFIFTGLARAQETKEASLQNLIDSKKFIFKAQSVLPQRGGTRQLTSDYDLRLSGDSIISYLPYFGRAYTAPIGNNRGGIEFTSVGYTYQVKKKNKGWDITIVPQDAGDVRQLFLNITKSGYARLQVISNNRETISYDGVVESLKR